MSSVSSPFNIRKGKGVQRVVAPISGEPIVDPARSRGVKSSGSRVESNSRGSAAVDGGSPSGSPRRGKAVSGGDDSSFPGVRMVVVTEDSTSPVVSPVMSPVISPRRPERSKLVEVLRSSGAGVGRRSSSSVDASFPGVRLVVVDDATSSLDNNKAKSPSIENMGGTAAPTKKLTGLNLKGLLLRSSSKSAVGFHDISWQVFVEPGSKERGVLRYKILVKHNGEIEQRLVKTLAQVKALCTSLKKLGIRLPEVKSADEIVHFFDEIFQTDLRGHDLVRQFLAQHTEEVEDVVDELLLQLGVNPGSPMGVIIKRRPDVELLVLQGATALGNKEEPSSSSPSSSSSSSLSELRSRPLEPLWQQDLKRHLCVVVQEEKARQRSATLNLIDSVTAESLSPEDQLRLRAQPKFQDLLKHVTREDGSLEEQSQNARATHTLMQVLGLLIHETGVSARSSAIVTDEEEHASSVPAADEKTTMMMPLTLVSDDLDYISSLQGLNLECQLCGLPSVDPQVSSSCGHLFCAPCLARHRNHAVCPSDGLAVLSWAPAPAEVARILDALVVRCLSMPHGCMWSGPRCDLLKHVESQCEFPLITCSACHCKVVLEYHDEQECEVSFVQRFQNKLAVRRATVLLELNQQQQHGGEEQPMLEQYAENDDDDDDDDDEDEDDGMLFVLHCEACNSAYDSRDMPAFCEECGGRLPEIENCDSCGTALRPAAEFCFECGTKKKV